MDRRGWIAVAGGLIGAAAIGVAVGRFAMPSQPAPMASPGATAIPIAPRPTPSASAVALPVPEPTPTTPPIPVRRPRPHPAPTAQPADPYGETVTTTNSW